MRGLFTGELAPKVRGLAEGETERLLQEGDAVAALSTSETAPEPFGRFHGETGSVVFVEGAASFVALTFLFEFMTVGAEEL